MEFETFAKNRHWESLEECIKLTTWGKVSKKRSELLSVCIWTKLSPNFFLFFPFLQADFPTRVSLGWLRLTMWSGRTLQPLNANCPCPVTLAGFQKDTAGRGKSEFSQSSGSIGLRALLGHNTWTNNHVTIVFFVLEERAVAPQKILRNLTMKNMQKTQQIRHRN